MKGYFIDLSNSTLQEIISDVKLQAQDYPDQMRYWSERGVIFERKIAPVMVGADRYLPMRWGIARRGVYILELKGETIHNRRVFNKAIINNRCLLPASGYFGIEKHDGKYIRYRVSSPEDLIYFAGCYVKDKFRSEPFYRFIILTQSAEQVHIATNDYIPVIVPQDQFENWLNETPDVIRFTPPELIFEIT